MDSEDLRGFDITAAGLLQRLQNRLALILLHGAEIIPGFIRGFVCRGRAGLKYGFWKVFRQNGVARA